MRVNDWLADAGQKLEAKGIGTSRLDSLVLLEDVLGKDRAWLLTHPETSLPKTKLTLLNQLLQRRAKHEPLAYIRGKTEFYGREFIVSADTLEPRPESETMIELLKNTVFKVEPWKQLIDVGTGSGALAITAKLELPKFQKVYATDISLPALKIARKNSQKYNAHINFYKGNLLEPLPQCPDVIIANLPYIPDGQTINFAAMQEPKIAIFGGPDGLDLYRQLFTQLKTKGWQPTLILTESLPPQHPTLARIARDYGYSLHRKDDFIQAFKPTD